MGFPQLRAAIRNQAFRPPRWAIIINPFFLIRRALFVRIEGLAPSFEGRTLDFGCGSKPFVGLFENVSEYVGVDIETSGHNHADSVVDVYYDGKTLPFEDGSFDNVVAFEVFEHVFNLDEVLTEIRRVLKPGGRLLFSVPFGWDEHERPFDFARYTTFGLRHILQQQGYSVDAIQRTNHFVAAVFQLASLYIYYATRTESATLNKLMQISLIFPVNLAGAMLAKVLPRFDTFFSGLVVEARALKADA